MITLAIECSGHRLASSALGRCEGVAPAAQRRSWCLRVRPAEYAPNLIFAGVGGKKRKG